MLKRAIVGLSLAVAFAPAALSGFGRWEAAFSFFAHCFALAPGLPGDYLRVAYYRLTLAECSLSSRISFGAFFAHPQARLGPGVYIGSYCIIGMASIGPRCQIASAVQILSGRHQHQRGEGGEIGGAERGIFSRILVGRDCWIGAGAIVMAEIGEGSTVGAGSVVTRPVPAHAVAAGNPARVIKSDAQLVSTGAGDPAA
jgi:acetyltransferase-like isoleucine patch superfamily enzyme